LTLARCSNRSPSFLRCDNAVDILEPAVLGI